VRERCRVSPACAAIPLGMQPKTHCEALASPLNPRRSAPQSRCSRRTPGSRQTPALMRQRRAAAGVQREGTTRHGYGAAAGRARALCTATASGGASPFVRARRPLFPLRGAGSSKGPCRGHRCPAPDQPAELRRRRPWTPQTRASAGGGGRRRPGRGAPPDSAPRRRPPLARSALRYAGRRVAPSRSKRAPRTCWPNAPPPKGEDAPPNAGWLWPPNPVASGDRRVVSRGRGAANSDRQAPSPNGWFCCCPNILAAVLYRLGGSPSAIAQLKSRDHGSRVLPSTSCI
jgi:hypothetical protein